MQLQYEHMQNIISYLKHIFLSVYSIQYIFQYTFQNTESYKTAIITIIRKKDIIIRFLHLYILKSIQIRPKDLGQSYVTSSGQNLIKCFST